MVPFSGSPSQATGIGSLCSWALPSLVAVRTDNQDRHSSKVIIEIRDIILPIPLVANCVGEWKPRKSCPFYAVPTEFAPKVHLADLLLLRTHPHLLLHPACQEIPHSTSMCSWHWLPTAWQSIYLVGDWWLSLCGQVWTSPPGTSWLILNWAWLRIALAIFFKISRYIYQWVFTFLQSCYPLHTSLIPSVIIFSQSCLFNHSLLCRHKL